MAVVTENQCVGCDVCYHCGRKQVEVLICDGNRCDNYAQYCIDGEDYCEDCARKLMVEIAKNYTIEELAELFELTCTRYE